MLTLLTSLAFANPSSWEETIERVSPSIVSIQVSSNRYFDTERQSSSVATGFIVDAERGHHFDQSSCCGTRTGDGPKYCSILSEIPLKPIYRDPIHDFGFYQYNPEDIRFLNVESLDLCLDCAQVGLDVRLIGNDAGEKISIRSDVGKIGPWSTQLWYGSIQRFQCIFTFRQPLVLPVVQVAHQF